jgi:hypothetical protein
MISDTAIIKEKIVGLCKMHLLRPLYYQRQHIFAFSVIFLLGCISHYVGVNYFDVPRKDAYITAVDFFGTVSAGYLAIFAASIATKRGQ